MTGPTQRLVAAALAVVLIRISWTDQYLSFVQSWMRWPLLTTGAVLLALAARPSPAASPHQGRVPRTSWLLLLPTVVVLVVAPPPLGAFIAERRAIQDPSSLRPPVIVRPVAADGLQKIGVGDFAWGATQIDDVMGLVGRPVQLEGFVSKGPGGAWYVTELVIHCCAADVSVARVEVVGQPAPPRDQWVQVTGTWVRGTGATPDRTAQIAANKLVRIPAPPDPYR